MSIVGDILIFLVTISVLVLVHECGHFLMARWMGVKVERFSLGFGKALWEWSDSKGTKYSVAPFLLGGYVKLEEESYEKKARWCRMLIMLAGVAANLLLAIVIFWSIFVIGIKLPRPIVGTVVPQSIAHNAGLRGGEEVTQVDGTKAHSWQRIAMAVLTRVGDDGHLLINGHSLLLAEWKLNEMNPRPLHSLGIIPYMPKVPAVVGKVMPNSPAAAMGLKVNDKILRIDNDRVSGWFGLINYIKKVPEKELQFTVLRGNKKIILRGKTARKHSFIAGRARGYLGINSVPVKWPPEMLQTIKFPVLKAFYASAQQTWLLLSFNYIIIGKLLTGKLSLRVLGGPITIFVTSSQAFQGGLITFLMFLALLSVMLAFINMLPIPTLDGGNFLLLLFEAIIRRPLPEKAQGFIIRLGFSILLFIIFLAVGNDLLRLL